jgi:hypothetical protein
MVNNLVYFKTDNLSLLMRAAYMERKISYFYNWVLTKSELDECWKETRTWLV